MNSYRLINLMLTISLFALSMAVLLEYNLEDCIEDNGSDSGIARCLDMEGVPCSVTDTDEGSMVHEHREKCQS